MNLQQIYEGREAGEQLIDHPSGINKVTHFIGPGDGASMVIPGSHKSNIIHPEFGQAAMKTETGTSVDGITGAVEVYLNAGDAKS